MKRERAEKQKQNKKKKISAGLRGKSLKSYAKELFRSRKFKRGSYTMLLSAFAIGIVLAVNLIASQLPSGLREIDLSAQKVYTIGEETQKMLEGLEEDVTIYLVAQEGGEDDTLTRMLERYEDGSDHVHVEYVDPVAAPSFTSHYGEDSLADNSLVVESSKRYKVIQESDIFVVDYDFSSYYMTGSYSASQSFDGEGQVTSAIEYVLSDDLPVVYTLTGHGETDLNSRVTDMIAKGNMELREVSLLSEGQVPDDADGVIINGATSDLSADEAKMLQTYLNGGGKLTVLLAYTEEDMANLESILDNYGMTVGDGVVMEGDSSYYYGTPLTLLPSIVSHSVTADIYLDHTPAMMVNMVPLTQKEEVRSSLTLSALMETSGSAFAKKVEGGRISSYEMEEGDVQGVYDGAILAEEDLGDGTTASVLVFASSNLLNEEISQQFNVCNEELFTDGLSYLCKAEGSTSGIEAKSMDLTYLSPSMAQVSTLAGLYIIVVPVGLLIIGFVVWFRRRKR